MLERASEPTNPSFGCDPNQRPIPELLKFGVIALDKPAGPGSHLIAEWVKKLLEARSAGHSGTLDPKVSGVLPIGINESTKVMGSLIIAGKEYVGVMHVHKDVPLEELEKVMSEFVGTIDQLPPVRSAVKRRMRKRNVYDLQILEVQGRDVLFRTNVQAGTYIRKLCSDIGTKLHTGAHMAELRRTRAGPFTEDATINLHFLADAYAFWKEGGDESNLRTAVLPVERAVAHLPKVVVKDGAVNAICYGASLAAPGVARLDENIKQHDQVAVMTLKGELVSLGIAQLSSQEIFEAQNGIVVANDRVIMTKDTYPKMWKARHHEG